MHQLARCFARAAARRGKIGNPSEAVPCSEPLRPRRGRKPARRRVADKLAGELDLAGSDRCAALGVAWPALPDSEPKIGGNPSDQGVPIEATRGESLAARPAATESTARENRSQLRVPAIGGLPLPLPLAAAVICQPRAV